MFGRPDLISSDRISHFMGEVVQQVCRAFQMEQRLYCPYHTPTPTPHTPL